MRVCLKRCTVGSSARLHTNCYAAGYPVAVQVESLLCFAYLCGQAEDALSLQLLAKFPSLLVPLASESQVAFF